ncbi:defensin-like protein [Arabidopsis thaliana]|uniref:Putative defensin-like protein 88 n=1 Tax=Arabidopsis thaliana TaxID=3702 RepID=DEF88_ARATH|nr:defensin-like protein [Arabidopsis thaliana]Q2V3J1.1 PUTATIVE PSEUDOGENE: RecName: Full=Putative defensin-like protein 88; Flags: Precursor [Arabidopsis thaliana]AEE83350.1 defensin-like protein [Arabidopsis thaliana]|eukprot:NP_001319926.1 defensin-like protein [Arabidopsis thaliana]
MATQKFSYFLLVLLMVFALILPSIISVEVIPCIAGSKCTNDMTYNELCRFKGFSKGGFCQKYVHQTIGRCCCHPTGLESQESSISGDTNVVITN